MNKINATSKRSRRLQGALLTVLVALGGAIELGAEDLRWSFREEFQTLPEPTNPMPDNHGNGVVWHLLRTTGSEGPLEKRSWTRDGRYVPLTKWISKRLEDVRDGWILESFPPRPPSTGRYRSARQAGEKGLQLAKGDVVIEPGPTAAIVLGWRSPVSGTAKIEGTLECSRKNGRIDWYVERGPGPDPANGAAQSPLDSGTAEFGSLEKFHVGGQTVEPGDFVYLVVDARADGTDLPHGSDLTRVNLTVTVKNANRPPLPIFDRDIQPILARKCFSCHGAQSQNALLDLRSADSVIHGGAHGHAVVPGSPGQSRLFDMLLAGYLQSDRRHLLRSSEMALVWRWIRDTVPGEKDLLKYIATLPPKTTIAEKDRDFWAFRTPKKRGLPDLKKVAQARTPIDTFLLKQLKEKGLTFSEEASPHTLIRRLYFDLIGLPPTPESIESFVRDNRPDAFERLVDRMLSSPHYGERWGRHWLDTAGYVDTAGFDGDLVTITPNPGIWRYRDWVVRSLNADKPYDEFITEQLSGDELVDWEAAKTFTPEVLDRLVATGYLRSAEDHTDAALYGIDERYKVVNRLMEMVSTSLLGLTMECSRCHDHKYDPIPQRDYYRLMACFETSFNIHNGWLRRNVRYLADIPVAERKAVDGNNAKIDAAVRGLEAERKKLEAATSPDDAEQKAEIQRLNTKIGALQAKRQSYGKLQALWDTGPTPVSRVLKRGDYFSPGTRVEAGFLSVLTTPEESVAVRPLDTLGTSSGRRLALSRWLTRPDHPLTARVFVNRVWGHIFGKGIVTTPGNLGRSGSPPTHPDLLDWLAVDLIESDWSLKRLQRKIFTSTAYRQSSRRPAASEDARPERVDPENRLLWRMNLRRLESEVIRDTVLAASGSLDTTFGGPPIMITNPPVGLSGVKKEPTPTSHRRRSLYVFARRVYPLTFLEVFDSPIMPINCTRRSETATVLQSLTFLNSEFVLEHADALAQEVRRRAALGDGGDVREAYRLTLARDPHTNEIEECVSFLNDQARMYRESGSPASEASRAALADVCQMLLCTNEFLYVD